MPRQCKYSSLLSWTPLPRKSLLKYFKRSKTNKINTVKSKNRTVLNTYALGTMLTFLMGLRFKLKIYSKGAKSVIIAYRSKIFLDIMSHILYMAK